MPNPPDQLVASAVALPSHPEKHLPLPPMVAGGLVLTTLFAGCLAAESFTVEPLPYQANSLDYVPSGFDSYNLFLRDVSSPDPNNQAHLEIKKTAWGNLEKKAEDIFSELGMLDESSLHSSTAASYYFELSRIFNAMYIIQVHWQDYDKAYIFCKLAYKYAQFGYDILASVGQVGESQQTQIGAFSNELAFLLFKNPKLQDPSFSEFADIHHSFFTQLLEDSKHVYNQKKWYQLIDTYKQYLVDHQISGQALIANQLVITELESLTRTEMRPDPPLVIHPLQRFSSVNTSWRSCSENGSAIINVSISCPTSTETGDIRFIDLQIALPARELAPDSGLEIFSRVLNHRISQPVFLDVNGQVKLGFNLSVDISNQNGGYGRTEEYLVTVASVEGATIENLSIDHHGNLRLEEPEIFFADEHQVRLIEFTTGHDISFTDARLTPQNFLDSIIGLALLDQTQQASDLMEWLTQEEFHAQTISGVDLSVYEMQNGVMVDTGSKVLLDGEPMYPSGILMNPAEHTFRATVHSTTGLILTSELNGIFYRIGHNQFVHLGDPGVTLIHAQPTRAILGERLPFTEGSAFFFSLPVHFKISKVAGQIVEATDLKTALLRSLNDSPQLNPEKMLKLGMQYMRWPGKAMSLFDGWMSAAAGEISGAELGNLIDSTLKLLTPGEVISIFATTNRHRELQFNYPAIPGLSTLDEIIAQSQADVAKVVPITRVVVAELKQ